MEKTNRSFGVQTTQPYYQPNSSPKRQHYVPFLKKNRFQTKNKAPNLSPGEYEIDNFYKKNSTYEKLEEVKVRCQKNKKYKQSVNFKSQFERFHTSKNEYPGPDKYNLTDDFCQKRFNRRAINYSERQKGKTQQIFNKVKYPSIPTNKIKYGYFKQDNGRVIPIKKSEQQLEKQREVGKQYLRTLTNEKKYLDASIYEKGHMKKVHQLVEELTKKRQYSISQSKVRQQTYHTPLKSTFFNKEKVENVLYESKKCEEMLGPGSYQISRNLTQKSLKNQRFEFFNSTAIRFKEKEKENEARKISIFKPLDKNKASATLVDLRKGLKKPKIKFRKSLKDREVKISAQVHRKHELSLVNLSKLQKNRRKFDFNRIKKKNDKSFQNKTLFDEKSFKKRSQYSICEWENQPQEGFQTNMITTPLKEFAYCMTETINEKKNKQNKHK